MGDEQVPLHGYSWWPLTDEHRDQGSVPSNTLDASPS